MKKSIFYIIALALISALSACESEIELDVPPGEEQIVIEGRIEAGMPPIVLVSTTRGFFEPATAADVAASYIDDAEVFVNDIALSRICASEIPQELLPLFIEITGIEGINIETFPICIYVGTETEQFGVENTTYQLKVNAKGHTLTSKAHIPSLVRPDSVWFRLWANSNRFGYCFAYLTDPDTLGNNYRAFTRRIGPNQNENPVDPTFYAPLGGVFADDFFNATTVEVGIVRGQPGNSSRPTDTGESARFFEKGDTFVLKFCSTDAGTYDFFRTLEAQQGANGSPFAAPNNVISNINGGLGIWAAYVCSQDTVVVAP